MSRRDLLQNLRNYFSGPKLLADPDSPAPTENTFIVTQAKALGVSGTEKFGGVFTEDYFRKLQGTEKAKEYDRMRRGDARVKMVLSAVKNPIRAADWSFQPAGDDEAFKMHAEFLNHVFKKDIGIKRKKKFKVLINEWLTLCDFGFSMIERAHKVVLSDPKYGQYIGLSTLGWRHPKTLERFNTDEAGELVTVEQQAYGDIEGKNVKMDAQFLSLATLEQEGDNYEGISLLRPCYGPWSRKQVYLKLMAIGIEKSAMGTPRAKVPAGKENSAEYTALLEVLERLTTHQSNYITYPEGWDIDVLTIPFDAEKVKSAIQFENEEMTFAFLANFLLLGAGGNGGAYALSSDLSDFFTKSILYIADLIADEFNLIGQELIELNFGPQEKYPSMVPQGIVDEVGTEWATLIKTLTDARHLTPDNNIEALIRTRMKLPAMREEDLLKRDKPDPVPPVDPNADPEPPKKKELSEPVKRRLQLAESKAQQKIGSAQERVRVTLRKHLSLAADGLVEDIMKAYKGATEAEKINAISGVSSRGMAKYKADLQEELSLIAHESIDGARREVPKAKKVKLAGKFEDLPKSIQKRLNQQSRLMVQTTLSDLEKVVFLQFGDSVVSTDSAALIAQDLEEAAITFTEGASVSAAGGNAASRIVNESRSAFFFDEEVLKELESFTFVNGDPVSQICQDLAGQTFSKDDVEAQRLFPPLHHNCKSYLVPNLTGAKDNPTVTGLKTKHEPGL